ncbi:MAG TPA: alpha/beta hydrolase [Xanthobacteraceae bacterium]|nr:alpha/beta hydrolase [Xanthobacteraceae bacterium]
MHGTFTTTVQEFCGARFCYRKSGAGDPVLLLHASACTGGSWRGLIGELGAGFSFYTPDLAGYGQSACEYLQESSSLRAEAEFVAPLLWDAKEPFHVIGHSFGGAVALTLALAWPERVKTLTLYEPTAFFVLRNRAGEGRKALDEIVSVAREIKEAAAAGEESDAMSHFVDYWSGPGTWNRLPAAQQEEFSGLVKKVIRDFHALLGEERDAAEFGRLPFPVTILRGAASPLPALRVAEVLAELIPQARLMTLAGVGHMAPVTHPQAVARAVADGFRAASALAA